MVGLGRFVGVEGHNLVYHSVQSSYRVGRRLGNSITPCPQYGTACADIQTAAFDLHTLRGGCRRMASPRAASQLLIWIECSRPAVRVNLRLFDSRLGVLMEIDPYPTVTLAPG